MKGTDADRFDGPEGVDLPRFSRRIGILDLGTRSSAEIGRPGIGVLRPFSGMLQPETTTDGRPLPDLSYLTLRPVVDRVIDRDRSVGVEEARPDPDPARGASGNVGASADTGSLRDPNTVAGASREPSSTADAGSPTDAEPTVREALRESGGSNSSHIGSPSMDDPRGDRDIRTLESAPDSPSQLRHATASQRERQADDDRSRSADPADFTEIPDTNRSVGPNLSFESPDASTGSTRSSRPAFSGDDPAIDRRSGPPLNVGSEDADVRGASRTDDGPRSDRADAPASTHGRSLGDARESRAVRGSGRGEHARPSQSSPGTGAYPTLRLREGDGSTDRANGTAGSSGVTDTPSRSPSEGPDTADHPSASRDRGPVSFPSDLSIDDEDAGRFVDALYRELERKARIERERRGL